jgi:hypothetical protein
VAIIDFAVAIFIVISLCHLIGRHWDWVYCYSGVISVLLVARQATGKV